MQQTPGMLQRCNVFLIMGQLQLADRATNSWVSIDWPDRSH